MRVHAKSWRGAKVTLPFRAELSLLASKGRRSAGVALFRARSGFSPARDRAPGITLRSAQGVAPGPIKPG